jgi:hypothetical protein
VTNRISSARSSPRNVYQRLSQRLDELAEREGYYSNAEKIRLMREVYFADVDEYVASGKLKIPKA